MTEFEQYNKNDVDFTQSFEPKYSFRKLATIRRIDDIQPIANADAIEVAIIDGWKVVVKKGEFNIGELVVYFEIDSWIPHTLAPFLTKGKEPREFNGVKGERLRTIKLRGQLSQGLILPFSVLNVTENNVVYESLSEEGDDVTEVLNIQKWEKEIHPSLAGQVKGNFPSFLRKTDQERIQNLKKELEVWSTDGSTWEVTEKMDGSSMTVYVKGEDYGVCSRNLDLKFDENNAFWKAAIENDLISKIKLSGRNLAVQGELCGPGIQGNQYNLTDLEFYCFDIFDIDKQEYLLPDERQFLCLSLDIQTVPVFEGVFNLQGATVDDLLSVAEGQALIGGKQREGLVFKHTLKHDVSFKVISNVWLMENE